MTTFDALHTLSEGNPGALRVLCELLQSTPAVDPDNSLGAAAPLWCLDSLGICGPQLWLLYKDRCEQRPGRVLLLLRAWQLGFLTADALVLAASLAAPCAGWSKREGEALLALVRQSAPRFNPEATPAPAPGEQ